MEKDKGNSPKIIGNGHIRYTEYIRDDDGEFIEVIRYRGEVYRLDDFMAVHNRFYNPNPPDWLLPFDGYLNDSYFSGILIQYAGDDCGEIGYKVYTFIS